MRRILFVFHVSSVGGGSYCLYNLLKAIDRTVFEPVVLLPGSGSLCDEISKLDIRIEYMPGMSTYPYSTSLLSYRSSHPCCPPNISPAWKDCISCR